MKRKLSPAASLLMSLSLVVGILVCDLTGHKLLTGARAQTYTSPSPCTNPTGVSTVFGSNISVVESEIADGAVKLEGVTVGGNVVASVVLNGSVQIVNSTVTPEEGAMLSGVIVLDILVDSSILSGVIVLDDHNNGGNLVSDPLPCESGVMVSDFVSTTGGVIVGTPLIATGGDLTGENIQVRDGVLTGSNLKLSGSTVTGGGVAISGAVIVPGKVAPIGN